MLQQLHVIKIDKKKVFVPVDSAKDLGKHCKDMGKTLKRHGKNTGKV